MENVLIQTRIRSPMKRRFFWVTLTLLPLVLWLSPVPFIMFGRIKNEPFFRGRPTSYWSRAVKEWKDRRTTAATIRMRITMQFRELLSLGDVPTPAILHGDSEAWPVLLELLKDADEEVRYAAVTTLGKLNPTLELAGVLCGSLEDDGEYHAVRFGATWALDQLGEAGETGLLLALCNSDHQVRQRAAYYLRKRGPAARAAIPALQEALWDPHWSVRLSAALALWYVDKQVHLEELQEALRDTDDCVRRSVAASYIGYFGTEGRAAIPDLKDCLNDPNNTVRERAAEALRMIAPQAPE